ncbi:hypothetical protein C0995_016170 [Termitomyces sp. Mi166|nr:hypothetical protein C0995_016170 [Termitomyces sp. Mi166\
MVQKAIYTYSPPSAVYATAKTLSSTHLRMSTNSVHNSSMFAEELHFDRTNFITFRDRILIAAQFCNAHGYLEGMVPKPGLQTKPTITLNPDNITIKKEPLAKVLLAKTKPDDAKDPTE